MECETVDEVMSYLERGSTYRHTGLTRMNEHSSRSHSVFTLVIGQFSAHLFTQFPLTHSQCDAGNITFCDFCCFRWASSLILPLTSV